ncbi:MAG: hypothetical protein ABT940_05120 [Alphaproteobacteria bacterium]
MGTMATRWKKVTAMAVIAAAVTSCSHTTYVDLGRSDSPIIPNPFERIIEYESDLALFLEYPQCIVVGRITVPPLHDGQAIERMLRESLVSRLRGRLGDVSIVDMGNKSDTDEIEYAINGCMYFLSASIQAIDETYLLIWSQKQLALDVRLLHLVDGSTLWKARHIASRSEGDIPFSALGTAVAVFRTKNFFDDADVLPSIIDDAVRRVISVFPSDTNHTKL